MAFSKSNGIVRATMVETPGKELKELKGVPHFEAEAFFYKRTRYCLVIPVLNEGNRIKSVLEKAKQYTDRLDIVIADKGSTDGSLERSTLKDLGVRAVLTLDEEGRLGSQLRMGYWFALQEGYEGILTIDGNDKDDVAALPQFVEKLESGFDYVQASRYVPGGKGINTPLIRNLAVRLIHAPVISLLSGFHFTDTTQGYRAYSRKLLADERLSIFRDVFQSYELLGYISVKAPQLGFRVTEQAVTRTYPKGKKVPTKISFLKGNFELLHILFRLALNLYDPK